MSRLAYELQPLRQRKGVLAILGAVILFEIVWGDGGCADMVGR